MPEPEESEEPEEPGEPREPGEPEAATALPPADPAEDVRLLQAMGFSAQQARAVAALESFLRAGLPQVRPPPPSVRGFSRARFVPPRGACVGDKTVRGDEGSRCVSRRPRAQEEAERRAMDMAAVDLASRARVAEVERGAVRTPPGRGALRV